MHKVFISYHHYNDQNFKDYLVELGNQYGVFVDKSVDTGDISDDLDDEAIREKIRDEYLRDSTVTIVLVGLETARRKHVDWEVYSGMIDGKVNKKSGILVVNLPTTDIVNYTIAHSNEKQIYPEITNWTSLGSWEEEKSRFPYMPDRIIDNLVYGDPKISVTSWSKVCNPNTLRFLIEMTFQDRGNAKYDFRRPMRRRNS